MTYDGSVLLTSTANPRVKNVVKLRRRSHRDELDLMTAHCRLSDIDREGHKEQQGKQTEGEKHRELAALIAPEPRRILG